jgi:hypothetical protein
VARSRNGGPSFSARDLAVSRETICPLGEVVPRIAMADSKSFLDNLKNLRVVMSVALEHVQENRDHFVKDATGNQVRQFEKSISQIRTLADRMETEFNTLEYLISKELT